MKVQVRDERGVLLYEFSERSVMTPPADMVRPVADALVTALMFFVGPPPEGWSISESSQQADPVEVTSITADMAPEKPAKPALVPARPKVVPFKPKKDRP